MKDEKTSAPAPKRAVDMTKAEYAALKRAAIAKDYSDSAARREATASRPRKSK